jgi:acyl-CoA hydrolase
MALMLSALFIAAAASAQASPVRYDDVFALASVVGQSGRSSVDLRMRSASRPMITSTQQTASNQGSLDQKQTATPAPDTAPPGSLTGTVVAPPSAGQQTTVETIELGEVQGTICDCGEILFPGGGFPLWPLLGLGAVPLFFIHKDKTPPTEVLPTPTPTVTPPPPPPPPPTPIPEPTTIFLLGTGLLAFGTKARRARARNAQHAAAGEV